MLPELHQKLTQALLKLAPDLSINTRLSYRWAIKKIWEGLELSWDTQFPSDAVIAANLESIMAWIDKYTLGKPKNAKIYYSALMLFRPAFMDPLFASISKKISSLNVIDVKNEEKQEWTTKQSKIKMPWKDIIAKRNFLENQCSMIWEKPAMTITPIQWQDLNDYVLLCLYTMNPPRRREFGEVLLEAPEDTTVNKNWVEWSDDAKGFYFNVYKTAKTYGLQFIPASPALQTVLEKWLTLNPTPYLLFNQRMAPLGNRGINRALVRIFNTRGMGVNMLRHIFISDEFLKDTPFINDLNIMARNMGHSVQEALLYKKH
jgi:hypothetical protein